MIEGWLVLTQALQNGFIFNHLKHRELNETVHNCKYLLHHATGYSIEKSLLAAEWLLTKAFNNSETLLLQQ